MLLVCTEEPPFLKMSPHYLDMLSDISIIMSISCRASGPGHLSYLLSSMNLSVSIRGEKAVTLFALGQPKAKSKTHHSDL